jgi:hypothetical protein
MYEKRNRMANTHTTATATDYEYPALCIPRSTEHITIQEIYNTFNKSGLGTVSKVVVKPKTFRLNPWEEITHDRDRDDPQNSHVVSYDNIYVYFKKWNTHNPAIKTYRDRLLNGQTIKIVFKSIPTPVFWRCVAARFKTA